MQEHLSLAKAAAEQSGGFGKAAVDTADNGGIWAQYIHNKDKVDNMGGVSYDGQALENGEYTIIDGALSFAERQPGASALKIYYNGEPVDQFTMHLGDTVTLTAAYDDGTVPENLIWLSSPETVLQLSYKDGSCEATATQTAESGALILLIDADTVISGAPRPSATVYVVP